MSAKYVRDHYRVPAKRGGRVVANGKPGVITGFLGASIRVRLDGERHSAPWHPTWRMEYLGASNVSPGRSDATCGGTAASTDE